MSLTRGSRIGPYEIHSLLGRGGMGEVYRARDTRLGRDIALKILPPAFAADAERLERFTREAQTLAALNHPHIAQIYGLEGSASPSEPQALIMEMVDGEDLAQRLQRGAMSVDDALAVAQQVADALAAAHEHGIIHRDLKPANIKVRPDGTVKVLDFGLAKVLAPSGSGLALANSPTVISPAMTAAGVLLGTAAYMSPEQATGKAVDRRTDLWAFGVVLLEMLTGRPVFAGDSVSQVLAEVLKSEPDWSRLPADVPSGIRTLLRRCLQRDPRQRLDSAGVAKMELVEAAASPRAGVNSPVASSSPWAWAVLAVAVAAAFATGWTWRPTPSPTTSPQPARFLLYPPPGGHFVGDIAISPDGKHIVAAVLSGFSRHDLWARAFDETSFHIVPGTEGAVHPFWAPDGRSLGFFDITGALKRVPAGGGTSVVVSSGSGTADGGRWLADGRMLYSFEGAFHVVPEGGGAPQRLPIKSATDAELFFAPNVLPGEQYVLFAAARTLAQQKGFDVQVASLQSGQSVKIATADSSVVLSDNHLLYFRGQKLVAHAFDPGTRNVSGASFEIGETQAEGLYPGGNAVRVFSSVSGAAVVWKRDERERAPLTWFNRSGRDIGVVEDAALPGRSYWPVLSPDLQTIAVHQRDPRTGVWDIWVLRDQGQAPLRLESTSSRSTDAVWSPDGKQIAYAAEHDGRHALWRRNADGSGAPMKVLQGGGREMIPTDWSPDGSHLLFTQMVESTASYAEVWTVALTPAAQPSQLTPPGPPAYGARFSPDGRWIAYASRTTGLMEVYVQQFPSGGGRRQITSNGDGGHPRWRRDGKELYYWGGDENTIMAVELAFDGTNVRASVPRRLFNSQVAGLSDWRSHYDASPDGQRFLFRPVTGPSSSLVVLQNWTALLQR